MTWGRIQSARQRMHGLAAMLVLGALLACEAESPAVARPAVLLVTIDTLRADDVGVYGYREPVSPVLDALAARGIVYERAIAASSRTAPSHATILTSRWVRDHSIAHFNGYSRLAQETTLTQVLSRGGYATAAFVSNSVLRRRMGLGRGYDAGCAHLARERGEALVRVGPLQRSTRPLHPARPLRDRVLLLGRGPAITGQPFG
jgi:hypothetical protein